MSKDKKKSVIDYNWIIKISIIAFLISLLFSFISETAIPNINIIFGILLTLFFIFIGIIFDMIGVSVTASDEAKFNSMASQKIKGARMAVKLKKNAEKVSSFCNDVVGDICGIISGSTGAVISIKISNMTSFSLLATTIIIMGFISALTIGGKAMVKGVAIKKSNIIFYRFSKFLSILTKD